MVNISHRHRGFTLIEAIMVITITGVLASMVAVFIKTSVDSYFDTVRRAELTEAADVALRKLAREVRLAVPNSLRLTSSGGMWYLEFVPTKDGGRYRNEGDGSTGGSNLCSGGTINAAAFSFDILGPSILTAVTSGDAVVVFNDASLNGSPCTTAPTNVYCGGSRAAVTGVGANSLTVAANAFRDSATGTYKNETVICPYGNDRFQVVDQGIKAVTYACPQDTGAAGTMTRYWNYGFLAAQPTTVAALTPAGSANAIVVQNARCFIDYTQNVQARNGLLYIRLTVTDPASGEEIVAFREIHVDNTP